MIVNSRSQLSVSGWCKGVKHVRLLRLEEAAERLGLKLSTLRFWVWQRKIEVVRVGRAVRVREDAIERLIEDGTVPAKRS